MTAADGIFPGSEPDPLLGRSINHYRIEEKLGGGTMGVVYRAMDLDLERTVALKFLPGELVRDENAESRFTQEARAASRLDHPHIATIYEIGETDSGRLFIAMPFYDGETLKQKIARGPLGMSEALEWARQISEGLEAAHGSGIVHRDLKPANVMITDGGQAKIVDFGLAKVAGVELTRAGTTLGTAAYMSPEQTAGRPVDGRSDLWSLGVLLYEMLAGARPFAGEYQEAVLYSILHQEPEPLRSRRPEVPSAIEALIDELLAKDPEDRPVKASVVAGRLAIAARGLGSDILAESEPVSEKGGRGWFEVRPRRWPVRAFLVAVAIGIGVLLYAEPFRPGGSPEHTSSGHSSALGVEVRAPFGVPGREVPRLGERSLAVLPFTYLAAEDSADYFSLGMTDELLIRLSQIEELSVISRTSVMRYRQTEKSLPEIARELGVAYVVEGTVQQVGGQVRIQAQLIEAATDRNVWAETVTRPYRNLLGLQAELARRIADQLEVTLLAGEVAARSRRATVDSTAYALYLQGRHLRFQETETSFRMALPVLLRSVSLDSTFAPAWATLSTTALIHVLMDYELPDGREAESLARQAAQRALELDSTSAESHLSMGNVRELIDADYPAAGSHFRRAIELNPGLADAHRELGLYLTRSGRFELARRFFRQAARLDPASAPVLAGLARNELYAGRVDLALREAENALTLNPAHKRAREVALWANVVLGRMDAARIHFEAGPFAGDPVGWSAYRLIGHAFARRTDSTHALALELRAHPGRRVLPGIPPYHRAALEGQVGEIEAAIDRLRAPGSEPILVHRLHVHPLYAPLRGTPFVRDRLRQAGLDERSIGRTLEELELQADLALGSP